MRITLEARKLIGTDSALRAFPWDNAWLPITHRTQD